MNRVIMPSMLWLPKLCYFGHCKIPSILISAAVSEAMEPSAFHTARRSRRGSHGRAMAKICLVGIGRYWDILRLIHLHLLKAFCFELSHLVGFFCSLRQSQGLYWLYFGESNFIVVSVKIEIISETIHTTALETHLWPDFGMIPCRLWIR
jgi:hypothetical protein